MEWYYSVNVPVLDIQWRKDHLLPVTWNSKNRYREVVEKHAYYFKREMHYDFAQFEADDSPLNEHHVQYSAFVFLENNMNLRNYEDKTTSLAVGSACFRKRYLETSTYCWFLDWIWLHPYFRHQSILTNNWDTFVNIFNGFCVEEPLSLEMESFLKKIDWDNDPRTWSRSEVGLV